MISNKNYLLSQLQYHAHHAPHRKACIFLKRGKEVEVLTYKNLMLEVRYFSNQLKKRGVAGKQVGIILDTGMDFVVSFLGCILAGATAVPLNFTRNLNKLQRTVSILEDADIALLVTEPALEGLEALSVQQLHMAEYRCERGQHDSDKGVADTSALINQTDFENRALSNDIAFLQYTSGSTSNPKGVQITHKNVAENVQMIASMCDFKPGDVAGGWLPQFHDMGLVGQLLMPLYIGGTSVFMSPMEFIQKPKLWLKMLSDYKVSGTCAPNFGYEYCLRRVKPNTIQEIDLSHLKASLCGSEPIHVQTLQKFASVFSVLGFREHMFLPCYGLAEATLLVSGGELSSGLQYVTLDKGALGQNKIKQTPVGEGVSVVSCGQIAQGLHVQILDQKTGEIVSEKGIGEVCVAGPSIALGIYKDPHNASLNTRLPGQSQPFLKTGDLGFLHEEQLFIVGRIKEVLIIQGVNVYPYDIEASINQFEYAVGNNGAFIFVDDVNGLACISAFVEIKRKYWNGLSKGQIEDALRHFLDSEIGASLYKVHLCLPGDIPKTTSGKIRRNTQDIVMTKVKSYESTAPEYTSA